ncbi:MAG: hypothetical protein EXR79_04695 [Myxococcales bacterium]|nr:hypothetical protein [Myxococcales bacterium]
MNARPRRPPPIDTGACGWAAPVLLVGFVVAFPAHAAPPTWVLPPGQEAVIERLLVPAVGLPAGWTLESAVIDGGQVTARFVSAAVPAGVVVSIVRDAVAPVAVVAQAGTLTVVGAGVPADLVASIQLSLAAAAADVRWVDATAAPGRAVGQGDAAAPTHESDPTATGSVGLHGLEGAVANVAAGWRKLPSDPAGARLAFVRALGGADTDRVVRAGVLYGLGRDEDALTTLAESPLPDATTTCSAVGGVAQDLARVGRSAAALDMLNLWIGRNAGCTDLVILAALEARRAGRGAGMVSTLEAAHRTHPRHLGIAVQFAHALALVGRPLDALALADSLDLTVADIDRRVILDLTRIWLDLDGADKSLAVQRQRADADLTRGVPAFVVGTILHHRDQWAESEVYLARSEALFAEEARQWLYRGMNSFHLGRQAEAEARVERASQLGSNDPDIQYCRAVIRTFAAPDDAIAAYEGYLRATAGSRETYAPKQAKVARNLADLKACRDARDVRECLGLRTWGHRAAEFGPGTVACLVALGALIWWWRRRRRARSASDSVVGAVVVTCACAWSLAVAPEGRAAVPAGQVPASAWQEALEPGPAVRPGNNAQPFVAPPGWTATPVVVEPHRIVIRWLGPPDAAGHQPRLDALLLPVGTVAHPWRRTPLYDVGYGGEPPDAKTRPLLDAFTAWLQARGSTLKRLDPPPRTAPGDLRPTIAAPTALASQWTWLADLDRAQVLVSAGLLIVFSGFFFGSAG